jgi:hypothetical protein
MTARDRRALLVGASIVVAAWGALRGVPGAVGHVGRLEESAAQRARLLERAHARLSDLPKLNDSITALAAVAESLPGMLLGGGGRETAEADLMSRVRAAAEASPVTLGAFQPHSVEAREGALSLAAVAAVVESDFPGLLDLVSRLEADAATAVEHVEVGASTPDGELTADMEVLRTRIAVSGWFRPDEAPAGGQSMRGERQ